jgi:hypothetical protein
MDRTVARVTIDAPGTSRLARSHRSPATDERPVRSHCAWQVRPDIRVAVTIQGSPATAAQLDPRPSPVEQDR